MAMLLISIALIGLLDAHRAAIMSRTFNSRQIQLRLLLEQQIAALEEGADYVLGSEEGAFEPPVLPFEWKTETSETPVPGLFRVDLTVSGSGEALSRTIYLREKADQES